MIGDMGAYPPLPLLPRRSGRTARHMTSASFKAPPTERRLQKLEGSIRDQQPRGDREMRKMTEVSRHSDSAANQRTRQQGSGRRSRHCQGRPPAAAPVAPSLSAADSKSRSVVVVVVVVVGSGGGGGGKR